MVLFFYQLHYKDIDGITPTPSPGIVSTERSFVLLTHTQNKSNAFIL